MIKTIRFGEKEITFSTAFAWTFIYKAQFRRDAAKVLMPVVKKANEAENENDAAYAFIEEIGFTGIADIAWACAKLVNKDMAEPIAWLAELGEDFDAMKIVDELIPEVIESCFTTKNQPAPTPTK